MTVKKDERGNIVMTEEDYKWIVNKTTQAARVEVLDEVDKFLDSWLEGCSLSGAECMSLCDCLQSLRQPKKKKDVPE